MTIGKILLANSYLHVILTCVRVGCWRPRPPSLPVTDDSLGVDVAKSSHDTSSEPELLHWASSTQLEPNHVAKRIVKIIIHIDK